MASASSSAGPSSAKIIVVGPQGCGKTVISNFLSGYAERIEPDETISPTAGCRILEFEAEAPSGGFGPDRFPVEIWDCSGDQKYANCWPALQQDADGVVIVFNPDKPSDERDLSLWHEWFVSNAGLSNERCMIVSFPHGRSSRRVDLPSALRSIPFVEASVGGGSGLQKGFRRWLPAVRARWEERSGEGGEMERGRRPGK
mmetsp:Transcript_1084/g.3159  ORF Transcript_1084/g.3159 Transcript_1084/m.3159 type:complete len:200 (-) Transcript_1084:6-605(-)